MNDNRRNQIECSVENCHYHSDGKVCRAEHVEIAPNRANESHETGCETFKPQRG